MAGFNFTWGCALRKPTTSRGIALPSGGDPADTARRPGPQRTGLCPATQERLCGGCYLRNIARRCGSTRSWPMHNSILARAPGDRSIRSSGSGLRSGNSSGPQADRRPQPISLAVWTGPDNVRNGKRCRNSHQGVRNDGMAGTEWNRDPCSRLCRVGRFDKAVEQGKKALTFPDYESANGKAVRSD